jgi:hypothetical protein
MFREKATGMPEILRLNSTEGEKPFQLIRELNRMRGELKKAKESDEG